MIKCTQCPKTCNTERELLIHRFRDHGNSPTQLQAGQGWYEGGIPTGFDDEIKAPDHVAAATRAQIQKQQPMTQPMKVSVPIVQQQEPKKEIKVPSGWIKGIDGYIFDMVISEKQTEDNMQKEVLRGHLGGNHGILNRIVYDKDLSELHELQTKENTLQNRLSALTVSDGSYLEIVKQLHNISPRVKDLKRNIHAGEYQEKVLEDYYRQRLSTNEHKTWMEEFMNKALIEVQRIKGLNHKDQLPIEKHKAED